MVLLLPLPLLLLLLLPPPRSIPSLLLPRSTNLCLHYGDICDGSESNVENSDDISPIIDLCPHNYVDICDDCGSVNRNFDDGFAAIQLCQHDEAICDDTNVGISLAASQLVNDDTTPSTRPLPTQQSCQYCGIMRLIQGKGGNPCKNFFPLFMHLIELHFSSNICPLL